MKPTGLQYLGTPYTRYFEGLDRAHEEACRAAAHLIRNGVIVYCPIAHSHPIAQLGEIDARDHEIWMPQDAPVMQAAAGLIVCEMPGWRESYGLNVEIEEFRRASKPVVFMPWPQSGALVLNAEPTARAA